MLLLLALLLLTQAQVNQREFKWGTYKPQLIHAITERNLQTYNPLTMVFYYFLNDHVKWEKSIKYKVSEVTSKELYNYLAHDAERFAIHDIYDKDYNLNLRNEFYKIAPDISEDWVSSVTNINPMSEDSDYVSVVYSFALEKLNSAKTDLRKLSIVEDGASFKIILQDLSSQTVYIYINLLVDGQIVSLPSNTRFGFSMIHQNPSLNWNCRSALYQELKKSNSMDNTEIQYAMGQNSSQEIGNLLFIQYIARKNENFHLQIRYASKELKNEYYYNVRALKKLTILNFDQRFMSTFMTKQINDFHLKCAKSSFSNLMGGYGLAYGDLHCESQESQCTESKMMLTMTPSREGFPRPFLWDDGFHNMLACKWNPTLCLQSLIDWFDTMTEDGWIPREQARGDEARSYYPSHFYGYKLNQTKKETNPPTFLFNFIQLDIMAYDNPHIQSTIQKLWPKLRTWYHFWFKSQGVTEESLLLKWWGPNTNMNFGSGMDDWPRSIYGFVSKYNVDACAWGWFFASSMEKLSRVYEPNLTSQFRLTADTIKRQMNEDLLDPNDYIYKDILVTNARVKIPSTVYSPHVGYPNLLPFAFGMIHDTVILNAHLDLLKSDALWSKYGIRSLSKFDENFGKGDNYWRGPIWIPINYLILRALFKYYRTNSYALSIYTELRQNVINLVCSNWRDSGLFYEHYNQRLDGKGQGHSPFNGCTSLITLIIAENYD